MAKADIDFEKEFWDAVNELRGALSDNYYKNYLLPLVFLKHLSERYEIVQNEFIKMGYYNERAVLDEWVIMPNHVHCIITLHGTETETFVEKIQENDIKQYRRLRRNMVIPKLTGKFQMQTSKHINILRNTIGQKTWQANYHDHVIRNGQEYERTKHYIINNPVKWENDKFHDINNSGDGQNKNGNDNEYLNAT